MRIVSGTHKSRVLKTLKGDNTRPTSDKIRGAIFDSIAFDGTYKSILDLFSGSGAMGLEALSRGFDHATLNDNSRQAINIIRENVKNLGVQKETKIYNYDYKRCLKSVGRSYDLIFIDPPYDKFDVNDILEMIQDLSLLNEYGIVIVEGSKQLELDEEVKDLKLYKEKDYKSTVVKYFRKG